MKQLIDYLILNSPWTHDELIDMDYSQLASLAYSYGYPNAPIPSPQTEYLL